MPWDIIKSHPKPWSFDNSNDAGSVIDANGRNVLHINHPLLAGFIIEAVNAYEETAITFKWSEEDKDDIARRVTEKLKSEFAVQ